MKRLIKSFGAALAVTLLLLLSAQPAIVAKAATSSPKAVQSQKVHKNLLNLKLRDGAAVTLKNGTFEGTPTDEVTALNAALSSAQRVKTDKLLNKTPQNEVQAKMAARMASYYKVTFAKDVDIDAVIAQIKGLSIVETAYAEPKIVNAPTGDNYQSMQTYLNAAPGGINATYAKTFPGGTGDKAKITDVEYSWNTNHEDLSKARTAMIPNGTPLDPFAATYGNNHGTAVIGEMIADDNGYGVTGITPNAQLNLINSYTTQGDKLVEAIFMAAGNSKPGDVVLIEHQTTGPTAEVYDYVPIEWIPSVYDMIKLLTDNGWIVVEPAGNGHQNLDDATYYGTSFPMGKADSGAIIVGAGRNCTGDVLRSRMPDSTYGSRVNVQGPGNCVATTGYGILGAPTGPNDYYTNGFSLTSAAAPVVAAAAASLNSAYRTLNNGANLTPLQVRSMLAANGTPQNTTSTGALTGNIGPLPDLAKALLKTDITKPTAPTNVKVVLNSNHQPVLSWTASTDNNKVASYKIYRNGSLYKTVSGTTTSYTNTSVTLNKTYKYVVYAVDPSNNKSAASTAVSITVR